MAASAAEEELTDRDLLPTEPASLELEEGKVLAKKYRLLRPAGFGGMAQLWVAKNEATAAEVCVKILLPDMADHEARARFRREAHAAARLSHRAIVRVFDLMELRADGQLAKNEQPQALAIVMELLEGETLSDLLMKRGKLGVNEALDIAIPFCSALAHAHRAGVIHRDIKPDNIFLARDPDGAVFPKVLDFGVSKIAVAGDATPLTAAGVMLGTPSFMSPEQAKGERDIDGRTDVFAAGIVLYMMLTGKNPFEEDSFHGIVEAILTRDPPRIEGIPPALWAVIARALAKDPLHRFGDANELHMSLKAAVGRVTMSESGIVVTAPTSEFAVALPPPVLADPEPADGAESDDLAVVLPPRRKRATQIVLGVVAFSLLILVVALVRTQFGSSSSEPTTAAKPSATAPAPVVEAPTATVTTTATAAATATTTPTPTAAPDEPPAPAAKPAKAAATARPVRSEPAAPTKRHPKRGGSVATDPGF